MELWILFLILAAGSFVMGVVRLRRKRQDPDGRERPLGILASSGNCQGGSMSPNASTPMDWSEADIAQELRHLRDEQPDLIPHFVDSVVKRFVFRQDDRTAQARLAFLRTQIEQLKVTKEFRQALDDLNLHGRERAKRIKTLERENDLLDDEKRTQSELRDISVAKKRKEIELEIARLDKEIEALKNPPKPEPKLPPAEERARRHAASDARLKKLNEKKKKAQAIPDDQERVLKLNAIDDEIRRETDEWGRTLP